MEETMKNGGRKKNIDRKKEATKDVEIGNKIERARSERDSSARRHSSGGEKNHFQGTTEDALFSFFLWRNKKRFREWRDPFKEKRKKRVKKKKKNEENDKE